MVQEEGERETRDREEIFELVDRFDRIVQRVSEEIRNQPVGVRLRLAWVKLRARLRREFKIMVKTVSDEHEEYVMFWEMHLDEMYEVGSDMTIIFHNKMIPTTCREMLW